MEIQICIRRCQKQRSLLLPRGPRLRGAAAAYNSVVMARATIDGIGYAPWFWARRGCDGWRRPFPWSKMYHPAAHAGAPPALLAEQSPAFRGLE